LIENQSTTHYQTSAGTKEERSMRTPARLVETAAMSIFGFFVIAFATCGLDRIYGGFAWNGDDPVQAESAAREYNLSPEQVHAMFRCALDTSHCVIVIGPCNERLWVHWDSRRFAEIHFAKVRSSITCVWEQSPSVSDVFR
jgi:hypothetical protein